MEEYPLSESSWRRARDDTVLAFHTIRLWVVFVAWEGVLMFVPSLMTTVSISRWEFAGIQAGIFFGGMLMLLGAVFLVSLLFAPYRQRNEARRQLSTLEGQLSPKLAISIEHEPVGTGYIPNIGSEGRFWRLGVRNTSASPIDRCYGEIVHFYLVGENERRMLKPTEPSPREGHGLPWARQSGGTYETAIGGEEVVYLDYITLPSKHSGLLYIPSRPNSLDERPNYTDYPVGWDKLEFEIAVGSRAEPMRQSVIRFTFKWVGASNAEIKELANSSPPVLDKEGS